MLFGTVMSRQGLLSIAHTKTPPAFYSYPADAYYEVAWAFDAFMMCSYAPSKFLISVLTLTNVSVIYLVTAFKLLMTVLISGTTSTLVFSMSTPLMRRQHFLVSSSLLIDSKTSSFSFFSSSISIILLTSTCASCWSYLYLWATFYSICAYETDPESIVLFYDEEFIWSILS